MKKNKKSEDVEKHPLFNSNFYLFTDCLIVAVTKFDYSSEFTLFSQFSNFESGLTARGGFGSICLAANLYGYLLIFQCLVQIGL